MNTTTTKPLGDNQRNMLRALREHGSFFKGCGWIWDNQSGTERILNSLVRRGLVRVVEEEVTSMWPSKRTYVRKSWVLTDAGREALQS